MARTDVIVLGAGIIGVSAALHLVRRGLAVALVDRRGAGEETSYGNAGKPTARHSGRRWNDLRRMRGR